MTDKTAYPFLALRVALLRFSFVFGSLAILVTAGCGHIKVIQSEQAVPVEYISPDTQPFEISLKDQSYNPDAAVVESDALAISIPLLDKDDPLLNRIKIRNFDWPMVENKGSYAIYAPQKGQASFYHRPQKLATGEHFNPLEMSAAHKTLPFGTIVRVVRNDTGISVLVTINDRGPYKKGRIIDLSLAAARQLDMIEDGVVDCTVEVLAYPLIETMGPKGNG